MGIGQLDWVGLIMFFALSYVPALFGSLGLHLVSVKKYYSGLVRPGFAPRLCVYPVVWFVVYGMLAVGGFLAWQRPDGAPSDALWQGFMSLHIITCFVIGIWAPLFFYEQWPVISFWVLLLGFAIAGTAGGLGAAVTPLALIGYVPLWLWLLLLLAINYAVISLNGLGIFGGGGGSTGADESSPATDGADAPGISRLRAVLTDA
jgi:tryptophan-rich sensory protein